MLLTHSLCSSQFVTDVMKPMRIDELMDQLVGTACRYRRWQLLTVVCGRSRTCLVVSCNAWLWFWLWENQLVCRL